jgi:hypothetical protein
VAFFAAAFGLAAGFPLEGFALGAGFVAFTAFAFFTTFAAFPVFAMRFAGLPFGAAFFAFFAMIQR